MKEISIESVSLVIFLIREKRVVRSYIFVVITVLGLIHVLDFPFVTVIVMSGQSMIYKSSSVVTSSVKWN